MVVPPKNTVRCTPRTLDPSPTASPSRAGSRVRGASASNANAQVRTSVRHGKPRLQWASLVRPSRVLRVAVHASNNAHGDNAGGGINQASHVRELPSTFTILARDGKWRIRQIHRDDLEEIRRVVLIQADGFHVPNPLPFVDGFLKTSFRAEVLSEMQKKLKYNPVDKFVCLVVERADGTGAVEGVVEVSYIDEKEVLSSLEPGTPGVVYVASMAVSTSVRRQGAAKALLEGAVGVASEWKEALAVLHVYQDNEPAVRLYGSEGWDTIFADSPLWASVGVRPRYLMRKYVL